MKQKIYNFKINTYNLFSFVSVLDLKTRLNYLHIINNKKNEILLLSNQIFILPYFSYLYIISNTKSIINTLNKCIITKLLAFKFNYTLNLELIGIGYKLFYKNNFLFFILGYSHLIKIKLPNNCNILIENNGKLVHLTYSNKYILGNLFYIIKSLKKLNIYKGTGIKNTYDILKLKLGKTKNIKK